MSTPDPYELAEMQQDSVAERTQFHDPDGDTWDRHAGGKRDRQSDAEIRAAIAREQRGEYEENGDFRPSTWTAV